MAGQVAEAVSSTADETSAERDLSTVRGRRALIIEICRRRQRPGSGSLLPVLRTRRPMMQWPDLRAVLTPVPWAVVGAVATRLYMPERGTADLDVLVTAEDFARAEEKLTRADWRRVGDLSVGGSTWESPQGVALGLPYSSAPWCRDALAEAQNNRDHQGLPILPLPYLVLVKLAAGRTLDIGDVSRMLGLADDAALQRVREAVAMHAPDDLEDLEALIQLGKLEWGDTA